MALLVAHLLGGCIAGGKPLGSGGGGGGGGGIAGGNHCIWSGHFSESGDRCKIVHICSFKIRRDEVT